LTKKLKIRKKKVKLKHRLLRWEMYNSRNKYLSNKGSNNK